MAASAARRGMFILFEGVDRSGKTTQCTRLVEHLKASDVPVEFMRFPGALTFTRLPHTARCPCHCSVSYDPSDPSIPIHPPTPPPGATGTDHLCLFPLRAIRPITPTPALPAHPHRPLPDRTTSIGQMINSYLTGGCELDDHAIHLLFAANRWEVSSKIKAALEAGTNLVVDRYTYSGVAFSGAKAGMDLDWCWQSDIGLPAPDIVIFLDLPIEESKKRGEFGDERCVPWQQRRWRWWCGEREGWRGRRGGWMGGQREHRSTRGHRGHGQYGRWRVDGTERNRHPSLLLLLLLSPL